MDNSSLDRILLERRVRVGPALPGSFSQNVWRAIRQRKAGHDSPPNTISVWEYFLRPQTVMAALALAITVGIGVGSRSPTSRAAQAHEALDLQVFGDAASALPSTLLAEL